MPIITLEVMPDSSIAESVPYDGFYSDTQPTNTSEDMREQAEMRYLMDKADETAGMHFLADKNETAENLNDPNRDQEDNDSNSQARSELLEYSTRTDGSVTCKLCGKILASRPHWYRHKYRAHVMHRGSPAPLFQCEQCLIYFKSRKGYIGHIASRHSETLQDVSPVLTNAQAEALARESEAKTLLNTTHSETNQPERIQPDATQSEVKKEPDPELSIPKSIVPTYQNVAVRQTASKSTETHSRKHTRSMSRENATEKDREEKRSREEKLVADIIARVRRECEAQGSGGSTRRGYSRKSALHT